MEPLNCDVAVLGSGPGGYTTAIRCRQYGLDVALIEERELGGLCLNWGCVPSKALLESSHLAQELDDAEKMGITLDNVKLDWSRAWQRSRQIVKQFSTGLSGLLKKNKVRIVQGKGRIVDVGKVEVSADSQQQLVQARHIVIATGGRARSLPGVEFDGEKILSPREAILLEQLPQSVVIAGGGAIGVEFADFWCTFGCRVHVVELMEQLLPLEDEDTGKLIQRILEKRGVSVYTGNTIQSVHAGGEGLGITLQDGRQIDCDRMMIAVGAEADIAGLGLDRAGVQLQKGKIVVDDFCRTSVNGIWAVGDVTTAPMLAHAASMMGKITAAAIAGRETPPFRPHCVPAAVYCQPHVAGVGLTERQARRQNRQIKTGKFFFRANARAAGLGQIDGFIKVIADAASEKVLGVRMIGPQVAELLSAATIAVCNELTLDDLARTIFPHPTLSEVLQEAALAAKGQPLHG